MTWFCPEPRWAAEMAPQLIDVLRGPAPAVRGQDSCTMAISSEMSIASVPGLRERISGLPRLKVGRIVIDLPGVTIQGQPPVLVSALPWA
jgi:hypothetical protein